MTGTTGGAITTAARTGNLSMRRSFLLPRTRRERRPFSTLISITSPHFTRPFGTVSLWSRITRIIRTFWSRQGGSETANRTGSSGRCTIRFFHRRCISATPPSGAAPGLAEQGPLSDKHRFVGQRYTLLPSGDGKCVETTQGTNDGSNPSARGASRAAILQRFSPDNKSFDRPGTASMRHTSKASGGILSSLREMNDSTSCYHAMTAVCHGCTAIDEILQSWLYIHHRRTAIDEVLLS